MTVVIGLIITSLVFFISIILILKKSMTPLVKSLVIIILLQCILLTLLFTNLLQTIGIENKLVQDVLWFGIIALGLVICILFLIILVNIFYEETATNLTKSVSIAMILQIIWFIMLFTNLLGVIGEKSELLQGIVWLGVPITVFIISVIALFKKQAIVLSICTLSLCGVVFLLWYGIAAISSI